MSAKDAPPRLGRGLAALLGDHANLPSPAPIKSLAVEHLEPSPFQPRGHVLTESLAELTESVRTQGILQPLLVRPHPSLPERYQIVAGERRWRAAQAAGLREVPVLIRAMSNSEAVAGALVENLQRVDLNAIEEAEGYHRLLQEFGITHERLAATVGKSRSHISNTLRLLNLPPRVQQQVRQGALSSGHARALLAHPDPEAAARSVIGQGLSVRQTEAFAAQQAQPRETRTPRASKDAETLALQQDLSNRLGLRIEIDFDGKGGCLRAYYRSLDQLDGLVALLNRP